MEELVWTAMSTDLKNTFEMKWRGDTSRHINI